jgi:hypothetical protein
MQHAFTPNPNQARLQQILHPDHTLKRDDVVWVLDYIKKKVADKDPELQTLPQPRLLENFHYFAEVAMMLVHQHSFYDQEFERLKRYLKEALYGMYMSH